ncbi:MAG TPA: hypothetical protein VFE60_10455 [Roseiarcus sp.]|nr:hypothetical protein [Roseiarcus sp.]
MANVAAISDRADVLVLVFAVDYWDQLVSKPEWTARQYRLRRCDGT